MDNQLNPADFSVDEKPRRYEVVIHVEGEIRRVIEADSLEEAEAEAERIADDIAEDRTGADLDEVCDVEVETCLRARPMFRVLRNGKPMQVSHLRLGDLPRDPDERGF